MTISSGPFGDINLVVNYYSMILRISTSLCCIVAVLVTISSAAPYYEGRIRVTIRDSSRNKDIPVTIIYPADSASGDNRPLVGTGANAIPTFGVVVMGHGYQMPVTAYKSFATNICQNMGSYVVVLPETGSGLFPNHGDFALDMVAACAYMQREGKRQGSIWKDHIANDNILAGHSMGGGAAFLAAKQALQSGAFQLTSVIAMAPAETNPSSSAAAAFVTCPTLILAGGVDCVTPLAGTVQPIYNNVAAACKTLALIPGASHCQFGDANSACNLGELNCKATITREAQFARCWQYINLLLKQDDGVASKIADTEIQTTLLAANARDVVVSSTKPCAGDTVRCIYTGNAKNILWLPDSVRSGSYSFVARSGNTKVSLINTTCFGTSRIDTVIAVYDRPTIRIEGDSLLCPQGSSLLKVVTNATPENRMTLRWSTGATTSDILVQEPGIYTATVTSEHGCGTVTASHVMDMQMVPSMALRLFGDTIQCKSTAEPIDVQIIGEMNLVEDIQWSTGDTTRRIFITKPGSYVLFASMRTKGNHPCRVYSDTMAFTLRNVQPTKPVIALRNDTLWSTEAATYAWLIDGKKIAGAIQGWYVPIVSGMYSVETTIADEHGCSAVSDPLRVTVSSVENDKLHSSITLTDNVLYLTFSQEQPSKVQVVDFSGGLVHEALVASGSTTHIIRLDGLAAGMYVVVLQGKPIGRFIKY